MIRTGSKQPLLAYHTNTRLRLWQQAIVLVAATTLLGGCSAFMRGYYEGRYGSSSSDLGDVNYADVSFDLSPDGNYAAFVNKYTDAQADLYLLNLKTFAVTLVAKTDTIEADPAFSNDGKALLYVTSPNNSDGNYVYWRSLESKTIKRLTSTPNRSDAMPRYSPDGSQILFIRGHRHTPYSLDGYDWSEWDLYMMRKDGSQVRRLTRQRYASLSAPRFSRDGTTIYYGVDTDPENTQWKVMSLRLGRGHKPKVVTNVQLGVDELNAPGFSPALSPDGQRMVFSSDREEPYEYDLYISNLRGERAKRISWHRGYTINPVFTRDGRHIYYLADKDSTNQFELWRTDVNGKNARRIADSRLFSHPLQWRKKK